MSIQERNVNTSEKKNQWIQIRVKGSEKENIEKKAKASSKKVSKYILDLVLTNHDNVNTTTENVNTKILKECILEFNKLMAHNKGNLIFPSDFDKDKIIKGVKKCRII